MISSISIQYKLFSNRSIWSIDGTFATITHQSWMWNNCNLHGSRARTHTHIYLYIYREREVAFTKNLHTHTYLYIYEIHMISFETFFAWAFKIVVESWTFSRLLLYVLWDDWPIFMISGSNEQLQQEVKYTLQKPDCHSERISKMQSDTLEERYAIKFCFKLGKNATETYGMLQTAFRPSCMNLASVFESLRDDESCGRSKEVNKPELIGQRVRFRVTILRF